jgi:ribonuclease HII
VAGVDEAGRGALAGPVVAAAVVLDTARLPRSLRRAIRDSKLLTPAQRERIAGQIRACAAIGVGQSSAAEVDRLGIVAATLRAMARAVRDLPSPPQLALVDGLAAPVLDCEAQAVVRGDCRSLSVASASIIAKVTRDAIMRQLALAAPGYGWEHNFGYATPYHLAALARLGAAPEHRRSFAPVRSVAATAR